ncbi:MAG: PAS domain-containing protein, partial [Bryobacter sp.]|nr:PAS domain-containing protein [Bryobacter sp.]
MPISSFMRIRNPFRLVLPALIVFLVVLAATQWFAQDLRQSEAARLRDKLILSSAEVPGAVGKELELETQALVRLAGKWALREVNDRVGWDLDVQQVLSNHPSLLAVAWLDNDEKRKYPVAWTHPALYSTSVQSLHSLVQANRNPLLNRVFLHRRLELTDLIHVADRGKAFAAYVPVVQDGESVGAVLGVFHVQILLDTVLEKLLAQNHSVQIYSGQEVLYTRGEAKTDPSDWEHQQEIEILGSRWKLRLWPSVDANATVSRIPLFVQWGGGAFALFLAGLVGLLTRGYAQRQDQPPAVLAAHPSSAFSTFLAPLPDPVVILQFTTRHSTQELRIQYANPAFGRLVGKDALGLDGALFTGFLAQPGTQLARLAPSFADQHAFSRELTLLTSLQEKIEVQLTASPLPDLDLPLWICTLRAPEEHATLLDPEALLGSANIATLLLDEQGRVSYANEASARILGYSPNELLRLPPPFTLPEGYLASRKGLQLQCTSKHGDPLQLEAWASPLGSTSGATLVLLADRTASSAPPEEDIYRTLVESSSTVLA